MLSRFYLIPECNGQTDRQICYINIFSYDFANIQHVIKY